MALIPFIDINDIHGNLDELRLATSPFEVSFVLRQRLLVGVMLLSFAYRVTLRLLSNPGALVLMGWGW